MFKFIKLSKSKPSLRILEDVKMKTVPALVIVFATAIVSSIDPDCCQCCLQNIQQVHKDNDEHS